MKSITRALKDKITMLSLERKRELLIWLEQAIVLDEAQAQEVPVQSSREVIEKATIGATVYQLESVRCGKVGCKCADGALHGPYWYGYRREGTKVKSVYIGKQKPEGVE